jgi:hypothetical protein
MDGHDKAVTPIATTIRKFYARNEQFQIYYRSTNSTRQSQYLRDRIVNTSGLSNVLKVDTQSKPALVEPNVSMGALVEATLKHGLIPPVIEFPGNLIFILICCFFRMGAESLRTVSGARMIRLSFCFRSQIALKLPAPLPFSGIYNANLLGRVVPPQTKRHHSLHSLHTLPPDRENKPKNARYDAQFRRLGARPDKERRIHCLE